MEKLFDSNFADVFCNIEKKIIYVIWKNSMMTFEDYQKPFKVALEHQVQYDIIYFLSDIREQSIIPPQFRQWFQNEALPNAISQGLTKAAVVFTGNIFKKYYLNNILNTTKTLRMPFMFFSNTKEAEQWLTS